jgi:hypothetical protein
VVVGVILRLALDLKGLEDVEATDVYDVGPCRDEASEVGGDVEAWVETLEGEVVVFLLYEALRGYLEERL